MCIQVNELGYLFGKFSVYFMISKEDIKYKCEMLENYGICLIDLIPINVYSKFERLMSIITSILPSWLKNKAYINNIVLMDNLIKKINSLLKRVTNFEKITNLENLDKKVKEFFDAVNSITTSRIVINYYKKFLHDLMKYFAPQSQNIDF